MSPSEQEAQNIADLLDLYVFPGATFQGKTPLDYETTSTGKRKGLHTLPNGVIRHDLRPGTEECILPPRLVWDNGKWFQELSTENKAALRKYVEDAPEYNVYVVTGEYTPGNYICRMYVLPKMIADEPNPPHPLEWSAGMQMGDAKTYYSPGGITHNAGTQGPGSRFGFHQPTQGPATPAATKLPPPVEKKIPVSVKLRCGGCGHWFSNSDLPTHAEFCCPGINGDDSDWAMQCLCCDELDQVASRKPGFPRPKPKPKAKPKAAAKPTTNGKEGTVAEDTTTEETDKEEKPEEETTTEGTPAEDTPAPAVEA